MTAAQRRRPIGLALAVALAAAASPATAAGDGVLRVCADPNNLPFSNRAGEGFENRLAEMVSAELGRDVVYTWWAQRRGFLRNTLDAGACDVVMGVPVDLDMLATTRPYYRSSYAYVYRRESGLDLHSMTDPRLRDLDIGVSLIGDDGVNPPPAHALGQQGIVDNVTGYLIYGDYRDAAPGRAIIDAVAAGDIDVAAVWGPLGGYFAARESPPLAVSPITGGEAFAPLRFSFSIGMGVRETDEALRAALDAVIGRRGDDMRAVLRTYGVPLLEAESGPSAPRNAQLEKGRR